MTFAKRFNRYACHGDKITCEVGGLQITARLEYDSDTDIEEHGTHDPECVECEDQRAKLAAAKTAWKNNEWFYGGVVLSVSKNGVTLDDHAASLWAVEVNYPGSDNSYLTVVANDLIGEATEVGESVLERLVEVTTN